MAVAGTLEIQLLANVARLQNDMNAVKSTVGSAMDSVRRSASMASSALAALGVSLGAAAFVSMIRGSIDAADHLNDLSKSTALTVEQLAGLRIAAKQSGTDLDGVAASVTKLAQNMGKDAEKFKAAGITARDPLEAFKQLADLFVAIEDPQTRAALGAATLGKSWATAAPLLAEGGARIGEMIDKGTQLSGVTTELAKQSDEFNDKLVLLTGTNSIMNSLTGQLLPLMSKLADDMLEARNKASALDDGFSPLLETFKAVIVLGGNVGFVLRAIGKDLGATAAQLTAFATGNWSEILTIRTMRTEDAAKERAAFDAWEKSIMNIGTAAQKAAADLDTMDAVSRRMASEARARAREESEAAAKRAKLLIGGDDPAKKASDAAKKLADEIAAHNKRMRELDAAGWVAYIEWKEKADIEELKENEKRWDAHWALMERMRLDDLAGAMAAFDALTAETEDLMRAMAAKTPSMIQISDQAKKDLKEYLDPAKAKSFGDALSAAFGSAGSALSKLINALDDYGQKMAEIEKMRATNAKINDPAVRAANEIKLAEQSANAQISAYGDMAAAAKGFFDTGSTGYKALEAAEKVFRAFELASAIQTMLTKSGLLATFTGLFVASKATETAATVASVGPDVAASMIKGQAAAVAGVANQAQGDPYSAWVRMAAMAAVMAGLGFAVSGSFNSGGGGMTAAERQKQQGTGTVLGDAEAKSNSLLNAIEEIEKTDKLGLILSHQMLDSLRAIQSAMGALASLIYRTTGLTSGAGMNIEGLGTQNTARPGVGGLDSLNQRIADALGFGSLVSGILGLWGKTTKEITDAGLFMFGRLGELMAGQNMRAWANVKTTETSWFGLSKDESNSSEFADLDPAVVRQFQLIFGGIADAVETAAKALDVWTPYFREAMLNIALDIGAISLKDLKGQELQDALNAIFSNAADTVAQTMIPGFEEFQRVGEGYFETLMRVATANEYVKNTFDALGLSLPFVGMQAITARMGLVDLAGGLEEFGKLTQDYYSQYYSPAEQRAQTGSSLGAEFGALGINMPTSTAGFRALVDGIDWAKEGANELFISLMRLAPTFFDYTTSVIGLDGALHSLDDVTQQHASLQEELDVLTGNKTAQFVERSNRMAEAIDATSQATLTAIFAEEDRQAGLEKQAAQNQARWDLEQELLDLTQTESEALARHRDLRITELALREKELNLAAGTLTSIQLEIDAQQDLNAERIAGAEAAKKTSDLEGRLGVLRGEYSQKELDRAREWQAAASDTDRVLLTQIYTLEDLATAAADAAEATQAAIDAERKIQDERRSWQEKLDILTGARTRTEIDRENFLNSTTDEATKAIMRAVFAQEDLKAAADEATAAVANLSAGVQPLNTVWIDFGNGFGYWMAVVAESTDAATAAANLAKQRRDLEIQLMEALGDAEGALAARRADILAGLDASLRELQQDVWDALDAAKLREAAKAWTDALDAWLNANSLDASLSPLTAQQALMEAQRQYDIAKAGGDAGALTAAADALLAADKAVEGFGGGYSALYAQIRADISGLSASGPMPTVGEAAIVTGISDLRKEVADAKAETARLLERLIEATRDQTDDVSGAVKDGTKKTTAAATAAVAVNARR